jgi:Uma2 family endonuclease
VEIISKSSLQKDAHLKFSIYEKEKVGFYVLVYPEIQKVKIYALIQDNFEKVFDSDSGSFEFELKNGCKFRINLDILW